MNMANGNTKSWIINKIAKAWTRHRGKLDFPKNHLTSSGKKNKDK